MARRTSEELLPCPGVELGPDFVRRLERLVLRLAAARERREGAGGAALSGGGEEFVGYRAYRPGEDLRQLDWSLYARLDQAYVRSTRREAAEHWAVLLDASASMGVGPPGKLQCAAELAAALASIGVRQGARVTTIACGEEPLSIAVRVRRDLPALYRFLGGLRAHGRGGLAALVRRAPPSDAGRLLLIGDLADLEPRDAFGLAGRRRELVVAQVLAPIEVAPPAGQSFEWIDPESGARTRVVLDRHRLAQYARALEHRLEQWGTSATRHGARYGLVRSDRDFEDAVATLLGSRLT